MPSFKFTSELQNQIQNEELFERILKHKVSLPLGAIIGTSYELNKWFQAATKIHKVPWTQVGMSQAIEHIDEDSDDEEFTSKMYEILNLETGSWSGEENIGEDLNEEEEAEQYYQKLLESEYK